jgi:hypothetical protein
MFDGDYKRMFYRCPDCGSEWTRSAPRGERKVRGWCKTDKQFVTPYKTTSTSSTERETRVTKPKPLW